MVLPEDEALQADAYIESLLRPPAGPRPLSAAADFPLEPRLGRAIDALAALPRFHPSFVFEESLAARLRAASAGSLSGLAEVIRLPQPDHVATQATFAGFDRRLIVGGAIASGVSLAGIAGVALAWRQRTR